MTAASHQDRLSQDRLADAADWVVRLQARDLDEAVALEFDAWLTADAGNAAAFDAALHTDREFAANAAEVRQELRDRRPGRAFAFPRNFYVAAAGLAAAAAAVVAIIVPGLMPAAASQAYATSTGERRSVSLADGSTIDLNAGTHLTVSLGRHERQVVMTDGQAVFDVAADKTRPFLIAAGDRTVRVVGTQFDVRRRAGRLSVTVTRGTVEVLPTGGAVGSAFRLHPGQRLEHQEGRLDAQVMAAAPEQALGWRSGRLVYRDQPLSVVVADLNALFPKPVRLDDAKLAATPVSGVFIVDNEDAVLRRLALLVSAQAVPSGGGVALERKPTP